MRRNLLIIALLLAVLCVSSAHGLPAHQAKPHKGGVPAAASHKNAGHSGSHTAVRAAGHESGRASAGKRAVGADAHRRLARRQFASRIITDRPSVANRRRATKLHQATETDATAHPAVVETASLSKTRVVMPPPLRGSMESLVRQNQRTEADGLERIQDDNDLIDRIIRGMLVPVPVSPALTVNGNLPVNRRYCRPWTATFLSDLAHAHAAQFHGSLEVSSAVRTVAYQKQLMKVNGNATAAEGDVASPHLTGATIDIAKHGMTAQEIGWMRGWLLPLEQAGKIDVEEEFQQACFHITVYKSYVAPNSPGTAVAQPAAAPAKTGQGQTGKSQAGQGQAGQTWVWQRKLMQPRQQPRTPVAQAEAVVQGQ